MKCEDCGNTYPALEGFPRHVFCKRYKLHMSNMADASRCEYFENKPITNADRIRAMSDEELAEYMSLYCCSHKSHDPRCQEFKDCEDCWLDWLKQEANHND